MGETETLNVDSVIARLLEGKFLMLTIPLLVWYIPIYESHCEQNVQYFTTLDYSNL